MAARYLGWRAQTPQALKKAGKLALVFAEHLDRFLQIYAVEKAKLEARKKGYAVTEQALGDGSIRLQVVEAR